MYHFEREVQVLQFQRFFTIIRCINKVTVSLVKFEYSLGVPMFWLDSSMSDYVISIILAGVST